MSTEIFNTATWNFLVGNRDVENIIRDNPQSSLVVRGGIPAVLPTVNCLRDLQSIGWKDFGKIAILSPGNTLTASAPNINEAIEKEKRFPVLMKKAYGINVLERPASFMNSLIVIVDDISGNGKVFNSILNMTEKSNNNEIILVLPENRKLSTGMRQLLERTKFATTFEGNNVFFPGNVEEVLVQNEPGHILISGNNPLRLFYSAIGAVDYFITNDAKYRNPSDLKSYDLLELGSRVSVIWQDVAGKGSGKTSIKESIMNHLSQDLDILSTDDDYRFTPVPGHKIAIDLM